MLMAYQCKSQEIYYPYYNLFYLYYYYYYYYYL
jgi:hypothetical protein